MTKPKRPATVEERIYRAISPHVLSYRIWPDPKPEILAAIRRAMKPKKRKKPTPDPYQGGNLIWSTAKKVRTLP